MLYVNRDFVMSARILRRLQVYKCGNTCASKNTSHARNNSGCYTEMESVIHGTSVNIITKYFRYKSRYKVNK